MAEPHWNKTVMPVVMQWDYGKESRGRSCDDIFFVENMHGLVDRVVPVWVDDLLTDPAALERRVKEAVEREQPDLIFTVPFRDEISPALLAWAKERDLPTFAWFSDDDWRYDDYTRHQAPRYSHVATTAYLKVDRFRSELGIEPMLTRWAGQLRGEVQAPLVGDDPAFEYDVSFVGGVEPYRKWFLKRLRKAGIKVAAFGHRTENGRVSFEEMERLFRVSRISLNIANSADHDIRHLLASPVNLAYYLRSSKRSQQMKGRNAEIPLAGGFQLTNFVPGLYRYFDIGREVAAYADPDDCVRQIGYFLDHPDQRDAIALAGHRRAVEEHTYRHRMADVFTKVWGLPATAVATPSPAVAEGVVG